MVTASRIHSNELKQIHIDKETLTLTKDDFDGSSHKYCSFMVTELTVNFFYDTLYEYVSRSEYKNDLPPDGYR